MRRTRWAFLVWPGLASLWIRGSWASLLWAVCAAGVLNLALLGSLVWRELLSVQLRTVLWGLVGLMWIGSALATLVLGALRGEGRRDPADDALFRQALDHYLRGSWFETERALGALLRKEPRDLEARLMLATLLRHAGRPDESAFQLDMLSTFEGAEAWRWEMDQERRLLQRARAEQPAARDESQRLGLAVGKSDGAVAEGTGDPAEDEKGLAEERRVA